MIAEGQVRKLRYARSYSWTQLFLIQPIRQFVATKKRMERDRNLENWSLTNLLIKILTKIVITTSPTLSRLKDELLLSWIINGYRKWVVHNKVNPRK